VEEKLRLVEGYLEVELKLEENLPKGVVEVEGEVVRSKVIVGNAGEEEFGK
jgi:hypothetical protein